MRARLPAGPSMVLPRQRKGDVQAAMGQLQSTRHPCFMLVLHDGFRRQHPYRAELERSDGAMRDLLVSHIPRTCHTWRSEAPAPSGSAPEGTLPQPAICHERQGRADGRLLGDSPEFRRTPRTTVVHARIDVASINGSQPTLRPSWSTSALRARRASVQSS